MTAKEKAKDLVDEYFSWYGNEEYFSYEFAKECALIAVNLVIENIEDDYMHYELDYWNEVKQEIEKI